tara:strand:- start:694 stop:1137 length:444 start_codon:yes stop_codon:yes gene_type:complete
MKHLLTTFLLIFLFPLNSYGKEYILSANGKITFIDSITVSEDISRTIMTTDNTFTDTLGDYGVIKCVITRDTVNKKVEFNGICEGVNQEEKKFWGKLYRRSDEANAGVGIFEYIRGTDKYYDFVGKKCNYAVRYFRESISFYKHRCN